MTFVLRRNFYLFTFMCVCVCIGHWPRKCVFVFRLNKTKTKLAKEMTKQNVNAWRAFQIDCPNKSVYDTIPNDLQKKKNQNENIASLVSFWRTFVCAIGLSSLPFAVFFLLSIAVNIHETNTRMRISWWQQQRQQ